jgi:hypothetical protein
LYDIKGGWVYSCPSFLSADVTPAKAQGLTNRYCRFEN